MTRWEYKLVRFGGRAPTSPRLTPLEVAGEGGWEAVAIEHGYVLCKRPKGTIAAHQTPIAMEWHQ